jgi:hypothetical protein
VTERSAREKRQLVIIAICILVAVVIVGVYLTLSIWIHVTDTS